MEVGGHCMYRSIFSSIKTQRNVPSLHLIPLTLSSHLQLAFLPPSPLIFPSLLSTPRSSFSSLIIGIPFCLRCPRCSHSLHRFPHSIPFHHHALPLHHLPHSIPDHCRHCLPWLCWSLCHGKPHSRGQGRGTGQEPSATRTHLPSPRWAPRSPEA